MKRERDSRPDTAWLAAELRDRAESHEADLERITRGFERLTAQEGARSAGRRALGPMQVRLIGVPLGILAVLVSATVAVAVSVGIVVSAAPHPHARITPPSSAPAPTADARRSPSAAATTQAGGSATARASRATTSTGSDGPLTAGGVVDSHSTQYWAQEDLTVTVTRAVTSLHVTVVVSGGTSVVPAGLWSTILSQYLDTSTVRVPGGLEYQATLKPGQVLQPATYTFGIQFGRSASGHDFALDTYNVGATDNGGATLAVSGTF